MENKKKSYWKGVEQLTNRPDFVKNNEKEFSEDLPINDAFGDNSNGLETNRRDFLKLMGFSVAAVSLAACETPVKKAIPYLNKPEDVDPGIPNYYASTYFGGGSDYCPVVVKTREGRPIHIEGNTFSSFSRGSINARAQASVVSLYDEERAKEPTKNGENSDYSTIDGEISAELSLINGTIYVVTNTIISPSTHKLLGEFQAKFPNAKVVTYDPLSQSGMLEANKEQFGKRVIPGYNFTKADVIVSVGADFLGNWVSSVAFTRDYSDTRKVNPKSPKMSRHYQFEANLSLTGANADYRTPIRASQEGLVVAKLYNEIASATGNATISVPSVEVDVTKAAQDLLAAKGKGIVVSGANNKAVQLLVNGINQMLENYGRTIDMENPIFVKQGSDAMMTEFINGLGGQDAVIFMGCNPVYDHPMGATLAEKIAGSKLSVATNERLDETASLCLYNSPCSSFLESWGDAEPKKGHYSVAQPTIRTIFNTRQPEDSLLTWMGSESSFQDYVKDLWKTRLKPLSDKATFIEFWQQSLHDGVFEASTSIMELAMSSEAGAPDMATAASEVAKAYTADNTGLELAIYSSAVMGWGDQANNPFLQETPDPISKVCWGNYVAISQPKATELGVQVFETKTNVAKVTIDGTTLELPIVVQPGLQKDTIAIGLGWGRDGEKAGKVAKEAGGVNAFGLATMTDGQITFSRVSGISIENTGNVEDVAQTQTHGTIMGRETIIQETTLNEFKQDKTAGSFAPMIAMDGDKVKPTNISIFDIDGEGYGEGEMRDGEGKEEKPYEGVLWNEKLGLKADYHQYPIHHWGMSIDLNSCTGCAACVIACHTENNVPIVGKQEVINRREMHWLRIDRYYSNPTFAEGEEDLEQAADNPQVVFQPMMCQHCNNAPCETVCPVAATTHSSEGLNQMTYNRCVGTKYCANNCPYKVRRFNWFKYNNNSEFDYHMNNNLGKMVLNPDVTVRSRGVMEKCSMCVQRIQSGKLEARKEGRKVMDGEVSTACATACPANAITFGDLNDEKSRIRTQLNTEIDARAYNVLSEINVRPNVWYLRKVRNTDEAEA